MSDTEQPQPEEIKKEFKDEPEGEGEGEAQRKNEEQQVEQSGETLKDLKVESIDSIIESTTTTVVKNENYEPEEEEREAEANYEQQHNEDNYQQQQQQQDEEQEEEEENQEHQEENDSLKENQQQNSFNYNHHHQHQQQQHENNVGGGRFEPEQLRKVFVGSLNYNTTEDTFRAYFSRFGDLVDCVIMKEPKTNKSRGFGFVTYTRSSMVDEMMRNRPHKLDGRELDTKRATPREESGKPGAETTTEKLFVGAIKEGLAEEHMKEYFSRYGSILDCVVIRDKETQKSRGFGFVTFDDYDPVDKIVCKLKTSLT